MVHRDDPRVTVVGGGLAGTEAAWQLATRGVAVDLYEMRPVVASPAHATDYLGELVCSNSLKSTDADTAAGCLKHELRALGEGTERVESEARRLFPQARIARLDRDTTGRKGSHRRILDAWRAGETDVLVGTQMVTKGHDIPGVTLVGVLLADVALNMPDFRAAERAFQLLAQVAGRAGRGDAPGRVLIQTYRPQHHALLAATGHDYARFAPRELALRRELGYPPFGRLAILRLDADADADAERAAADLAARARAAAEGEVTVRGPAPAPLERLRGRYRWQVLVASPRVHPLHVLLQRLQSFWASAPGTRAVRLVIDVDPVSML